MVEHYSPVLLMANEKNKTSLVCIVDDDVFLGKLYEKKAKQLGVALRIAKTAEEALVLLQNGLEPDVLLVDIHMAKMSGLELLQRIRDEKLVPNARIIILTNSDDKEAQREAQRLKADDYILKIGQLAPDVLRHALLKARHAKTEIGDQ